MWSKIRRLFSSYVFNICLVIGIAALVMYLTLRNNPKDVWAMLRHADVKWIMILILSVIGIRVLSGYALREETRLSYPDYSLFKGVATAFTGGFFNEITPSATGGQFAQVIIFRRQGVDLADSASVLWMDFILYQVMVVAVDLVLVILKFHAFFANASHFFLIVLLGFAVNAGVIVIMFALTKSQRFYHWLTTTGISLGMKLKLVKDREKTLASLEQQLNRFQKEVDALSKHKGLMAKVCIAHGLRLILYYSMPVSAAHALHVSPVNGGFLDALALASYVTMVNAFIPSPGSSGGTEAVFLLMFSAIYHSSDASAILILWRFMSYYLDMIIGAVVFFLAKNIPFRQAHRITETNEVQQ
ncbi:MAG: lysylphosphatidylglycerol synthase transmembrane domain-containing protein [Bulleidia sp.]|nr:lysylphosphatidylglycerol synthase transmembrane domain-containing protein [Bulleidia sp.]